ncbi:hypothetical protein JW887_00965 [Candidatus Dojkabacteria bacterium]|nr:hypothetical protein [Candidatus Dojkabacteria bacterium]
MKKDNETQILGSITPEIILPIISDGAIASSGLAEARFIPILIVDTSMHTSIDDLVRLHDSAESGDVDSLWGIDKHNDHIYLHLEFKQPVKTIVALKFDILKQGGIVDTIMSTRILNLQPGKIGDRPGNTLDKPSIYVEVPDRSLKDVWTKRWKKVLI